jgi:hypothetical protein
VEILMSIWRSEEANRREAAVQRLVAAKTPSTDAALIEAQTKLIQYKAETLQWTMPVGFALGLLISGFGVRALSQFIDPASIGTPLRANDGETSTPPEFTVEGEEMYLHDQEFRKKREIPCIRGGPGAEFSRA